MDGEHPWIKVVQTAYIMTFFHENHDIPQAGHLGREKTLDRIRQNYYWPGMTQDIKSFVENCEVCTKVKYNQRTTDYQARTITLGPIICSHRRLSIRSKRRNSNLIFVVKTLETIFDRWGTPRSIITDNGTEYINKDVRALLLARGVKHITTPLSHPHSNLVKCVNRTIKPMISAFINENHREWDKNLSKIQLAYSTVPHSGSRVSPFFLNRGR